MKQIYLNAALLIGLSLGLTACGDPQAFLNNIIESKKYIPYNTPMSSSGVGTILSGSAAALRVAAPPETCFPDTLNGQATKLRWVEQTDLPYVSQKIKMGFGAQLSGFLLMGTPIAKLNLGFNYAKDVELSFEEASVETLNEINFFDHYQKISENCRLFFATHPFVTQALRVGKMKFKFYTAGGALIELSPQALGDIIHVGVGVNWQIENKYTLTIDTPKYIGYQVGFMGTAATETPMIPWHAYRLTRDGRFAWEKTDVAPMSAFRALSRTRQLAEPLHLLRVGQDLL